MIGIPTFVNDKEAYLSDYILSHINGLSVSIEAQIDKTLLFTRWMHHQSGSVPREKAKEIGLKQMLVLAVDKDGVLKTMSSFNDEEKVMVHLLDQLGWDGTKLLNHSVLIGKTAMNELVVGSLIRSHGGGTAYIAVIDIRVRSIESVLDYQAYLVDSLGDPLFSKGQNAVSINRVELSKFLSFVSSDGTASGLKRWKSNHTWFLTGYRRLKFKELAVLEFVPEHQVFSAIRGVLSRSVILFIGILLVSSGVALLLMRRLSSSLKNMSLVLNKFEQGSFTYRVDTSGLTNDELGVFATSFNKMAEKLDTLIVEAANKVENRIEGEIVSKTNQWLPSKVLEQGYIQFCGKILPSPQYGGDWCYYDQIRDYVIFGIGNSKGRGAPSALLTAAVRSVISSYIVSLNMVVTQAPSLSDLVSQINRAVYEVLQGKLEMNCFIGIIDTLTGEMEVFNGSHPVPYLHRLEFESRPEDPSRRFELLSVKNRPPLGSSSNLKAETKLIQLNPGDMIFLYTGGLFNLSNSTGAILGLKWIFEVLASSYDESNCNASRINEDLFSKMSDFFGPVALQPSNDLSFAVLAISKKATFSARDEVA
jgi:sigma-B regulation protein RsbU (phosphoserine phosphatase)